jgi:hypothetical protein
MVSFRVCAKLHSRQTHKSCTTSALPLPCSLFNSQPKVPVVSGSLVTKSPVVHPLPVQLLTKCYFRNSFVLKMIHFDGGGTPCGPFFPPSWALPCTFSHSAEMQLSCFQSIVHSFAQFCRHAKLNSFLFNQFRTLSQKHPGGVGMCRKKTDWRWWRYSTRRTLRRNSSTTDSWNG